jgi:hypothetical protein
LFDEQVSHRSRVFRLTVNAASPPAARPRVLPPARNGNELALFCLRFGQLVAIDGTILSLLMPRRTGCRTSRVS